MKNVMAGDDTVDTPVVSDDELGVLASQFNSMVAGLRDQNFIRKTLGKFVPDEVASLVIENHGILAPQIREATVLFSDIEGFASIAEKLTPAEIVEMLNVYFRVVSEPVHRHHGVITQFQGDAMLVSFNLPVDDPDHVNNALRAAHEIQSLVRTTQFLGAIALPTRIGVNTGQVVGGTVGSEGQLGYTIHGDGVNMAARLEQLNKTYKTRVLVSARTAELADGSFELTSVGEVVLRGREQALTVFELGCGTASVAA